MEKAQNYEVDLQDYSTYSSQIAAIDDWISNPIRSQHVK